MPVYGFAGAASRPAKPSVLKDYTNTAHTQDYSRQSKSWTEKVLRACHPGAFVSDPESSPAHAVQAASGVGRADVLGLRARHPGAFVSDSGTNLKKAPGDASRDDMHVLHLRTCHGCAFVLDTEADQKAVSCKAGDNDVDALGLRARHPGAFVSNPEASDAQALFNADGTGLHDLGQHSKSDADPVLFDLGYMAHHNVPACNSNRVCGHGSGLQQVCCPCKPCPFMESSRRSLWTNSSERQSATFSGWALPGAYSSLIFCFMLPWSAAIF